jgi:hypothetical protein
MFHTRIIKTSRSGVAALREKLKPHATAQRRNERTRIFLKINISWERRLWPEKRPV